VEPDPIHLFGQLARGSPFAWAGLAAMLASVYVVARVVVWSSIFVAIRPWRRAAAGSWVERARLAWPARRFGKMAPPLIVAAMTIALAFARRESRAGLLPAIATNFLVAAAAWLGGLHAAIAWGRRVNPSWTITPRPERGAWISSLSWLGPLLVLGCTLFFLAPATWDARAWAMLSVGTVAVGLYAGWGWRDLMRWTGILRPADDRFREIATRSAERAGIELRSIEQAALPMVNAFAFVYDRGIGVTDAALAVLDDDELDAICAHELAHLAEPGWVKAIRLSFGFFWGLLVASLGLLSPMVKSLEPQAVLFIFSFGLAGLLVANGAFLRLVRRMEVRADARASPAEAAPGVYGRALAKIYEMNLVPVVLGAKRRTHPELYDRLVAVGLNPDYPRPAAPPRGPWFAGLLALILGSIVGGFVVSDLVARRIPRGVFAPESATLWTIGAMGGSYDEFSVLTEVDRDGGGEDAE
jgi:Zn-dependent protease with chaperone function